MVRVVTSCSNTIEEFTLGFYSSYDRVLDGLACELPAVTRWRGCYHLLYELANIQYKLPNLEDLSLRCAIYNDHHKHSFLARYILEQTLKRQILLRSLILFDVNKISYKFLEHIPNLTILLLFITDVDDTSCETIARNGTQIQHLHLYLHNTVDGRLSVTMTGIRSIQALNNLKKLSFQCFDGGMHKDIVSNYSYPKYSGVLIVNGDIYISY